MVDYFHTAKTLLGLQSIACFDDLVVYAPVLFSSPCIGAGRWKDDGYSSASDISDTDCDAGDSSDQRGWRVRLASLACLQVNEAKSCWN